MKIGSPESYLMLDIVFIVAFDRAGVLVHVRSHQAPMRRLRPVCGLGHARRLAVEQNSSHDDSLSALLCRV
jgi:hypothetical protein